MSQPSLLLTRRRLMTLMGAGAALSSAFVAQAVRAADGTDQGPTLRFAHLKGGDEIILRASGEAQVSYPISYAEFATGAQIIEAINADAVDFGTVSDVAPVLALQSQARVRFIAALKVDVSNVVILIPKESAITSPADLKGKRVGYVRASTSHYFLLKLLERTGLGLSDITAVNLSPADGRAAFLRGDIDAWSIFYPFANIVANATGATTLVNANGYLPGQFVLAANPGAVADPARHALVEDYVRRLRRAYRWGEQHRHEWATAAAESLHLPQALVDQWVQGWKVPFSLGPVTDAAIAAMQDTADIFARAGQIAALDVRPFWDRSFNDALSES